MTGRKQTRLEAPHPRSRQAYLVAAFQLLYDTDEDERDATAFALAVRGAADDQARALRKVGASIDPRDPSFIASVAGVIAPYWLQGNSGAKPKPDRRGERTAPLRPHRAIAASACDAQRARMPTATDNAICKAVASWLSEGIPTCDMESWQVDDDHVRRAWYSYRSLESKNKLSRSSCQAIVDGKSARPFLEQSRLEAIVCISRTFSEMGLSERGADPVATFAFLHDALVRWPLEALIEMEAAAKQDPRFKGISGEQLADRIDCTATDGVAGCVQKLKGHLYPVCDFAVPAPSSSAHVPQAPLPGR